MEEEKKEAKKEKKFEQAAGENKKSMYSKIIGVIVIIMVFIAIIVGFLVTRESPTSFVEKMLQDLKTGNYSQEMLANTLSEEDFSQEARNLLFNKLEWKIQNVTEEEERATVEIEITNKDFKTIISNYMQKAVKMALRLGQSMNQEEMTNYLIEELKNEEVQTVTNNQTILLEKREGKWELSQENDLFNILLPGYQEAMNAFH